MYWKIENQSSFSKDKNGMSTCPTFPYEYTRKLQLKIVVKNIASLVKHTYNLLFHFPLNCNNKWLFSLQSKHKTFH